MVVGQILYKKIVAYMYRYMYITSKGKGCKEDVDFEELEAASELYRSLNSIAF